MRRHLYLLPLALALVSSCRAGGDGIVRLVTPRGGEYSVILPDGTRVWLNVESELTYPSRFRAGSREVHLRGEAYFKTVPDAREPFVIHAGGVTLLVPGTECNVRVAGEEVIVTPVGGALLVRAGGGQAVCHPRVGQQAVWRAGAFTVADADIGLNVAWKEGYFDCRGVPLEQVLEELARWYDFTYSFRSSAARARVVTARFSRFDDLDRVLVTLSSDEFLLVREGKTVVVTARR
ncbi:MAG: FecR domain-containing protein [Odoribacteraceae bacterium]|nr:FecR domain-containing protein [Odoribacteraceae bacterium]